jgi:hypothetical protein
MVTAEQDLFILAFQPRREPIGALTSPGLSTETWNLGSGIARTSRPSSRQPSAFRVSSDLLSRLRERAKGTSSTSPMMQRHHEILQMRSGQRVERVERLVKQ